MRGLPASIHPGPLVVTAWLWIGISSLMLLLLEHWLPGPTGSGNELVTWLGWSELWLEPGRRGVALAQGWMAVNTLFVLALWVDSRSSWFEWRADRYPRLVAQLGTAILLLALQWALATSAAALPHWRLLRIYPPAAG